MFVLRYLPYKFLLTIILLTALPGCLSAQDSLSRLVGLHLEITNQGEELLIIQAIQKGSKAASLDIQPGDRLIAVNGVNVVEQHLNPDSLNFVFSHLLSKPLTLELERLMAHKARRRNTYSFDAEPMPAKGPKVYGIGVTLHNDTVEIKQHRLIKARVQTVIPTCPAFDADIRVGDIIEGVNTMRCAANEPNPVAWVITVLLSDEATPVHVTILRQQEDDWVSLDKQMRRVDIRPYLPLNNTLLPVPSQAKPAQQGVTGDKDGDGIPDTEDACPDEAGVYSLNPYENGCPEKKK